jgi:hypothetical protein
MKPAAGSSKAQAPPRQQKPPVRERRKIHPVVIYPFEQPADYSDLQALYNMVALLDADRDRYARPVTVMDRKTHYRNQSDPVFIEFRKGTLSRCSDILDAWSVDTCQMWYCGLASAFEAGGPEDVYWLIPGDFNYGVPAGKDVLGRLHDLPEIIADLEQDLCIGEIATSHSHSKQLIDTYGTFALLYTWFPDEARGIREVTERPRSEFLAIRHSFLGEVLQHRWYAYEQTVIVLLHAIFNRRRISRFFVGNISDLPSGKESLNSAIQQVERTERLLKSFWRERHHKVPDWPSRYQALEAQSDVIRKAAFQVLRNVLD